MDKSFLLPARKLRFKQRVGNNFMLAKAIRKNDNISGILVNNKEIKLSQ